jgi:multicomponent Na+:H+ antiporter subunit B
VILSDVLAVHRDYLFAMQRQNRPDNTVSAIYLGYRALDTLGETLVLLVSITGTMSILINLGRHKMDEEAVKFSLEPEKLPRHSLRTNLIEVVASKLGPIVLLFGFYVMLYGHISPGGGFHGGVILPGYCLSGMARVKTS